MIEQLTGRVRWAVTYYHDEPEEASANVRASGVAFVTEQDAIDAARSHIDDYWQTATVERGLWYPPVPGQCPAFWEWDDEAAPVRLGADWIER